MPANGCLGGLGTLGLSSLSVKQEGPQEWFEEECVHWDDIQRDDNVVSSADIHTKVAAVQVRARGALL